MGQQRLGLQHLVDPPPFRSVEQISALGGAVKAPVCQALNSDGRIEIFGIGTDNAAYHDWQTAPHAGPWRNASRTSRLTYCLPTPLHLAISTIDRPLTRSSNQQCARATALKQRLIGFARRARPPLITSQSEVLPAGAT